MLTAILLGIGTFMLFMDLPKSTRTAAGSASWIPHIVAFVLMFWLHGGTGEGAVLAGVAVVIFRWLMPLGVPRKCKPGEQHRGFIYRALARSADNYNVK